MQHELRPCQLRLLPRRAGRYQMIGTQMRVRDGHTAIGSDHYVFSTSIAGARARAVHDRRVSVIGVIVIRNTHLLRQRGSRQQCQSEQSEQRSKAPRVLLHHEFLPDLRTPRPRQHAHAQEQASEELPGEAATSWPISARSGQDRPDPDTERELDPVSCCFVPRSVYVLSGMDTPTGSDSAAVRILPGRVGGSSLSSQTLKGNPTCDSNSGSDWPR